MISFASRDSLLMEKVLSSGKKGLNFPSKCRLHGHLDSSVIKPNNPPTRPKGSTLTKEEVSSIERYEPVLTGAGRSLSADSLHNTWFLVFKNQGKSNSQGSLRYIEGWFWEMVANDNYRTSKTITWNMLRWDWQHLYSLWQHTYYARGTRKSWNCP